MPAKGWMSVRNLPTGKKTVKEILKEFANEYDKCGKCHGRGFIVEDEKVDIASGVTTVRYSDIEPLAEMHEDGLLNGDVIKRIVETMEYNRQQCDKCKGFGFVEKSRKKKDEGTVKKRKNVG